MEQQSHLRVLTQLVDRLTDKKHAELDPDALRRLKRLCKGIGDSAIKTIFALMMEKVREQHARVRSSVARMKSTSILKSDLARNGQCSNCFTAKNLYSRSVLRCQQSLTPSCCADTPACSTACFRALCTQWAFQNAYVHQLYRVS